MPVTIDLKITKAFFDAEKVKRQMTNARRKTLVRAGGLVRAIARNSIKKKPWRTLNEKRRGRQPAVKSVYVHDYLPMKTDKSISYKVPYSHDRGGISVRDIVFVYDRRNESVRVGPQAFSRGNPDIIEALENGGSIKERIPSWATAARERYGVATLSKRITKRPFMRPALEKFQDKYPDLWKDTLR